MTTARKIQILNWQVDKLQITEASLNTFHASNWKTETLEYLRIFFGENSEVYKKCKQYNEEVEEEYRTKNYGKGSAIFIIEYTELLYTSIGILQRGIYKKSKVLQLIHGLSLGTLIGLIALSLSIAYYVGRWEGIKTGQSLVNDTSKNVTCKNNIDSTTNQFQHNQPRDTTHKF